MLLSTKEEVTSFLHKVLHPDLAGYRPDRVLGLFRTESQTGGGLMEKSGETEENVENAQW